MTSINTKIVRASFWSTLSEIISKLITPITSIILARLLAPEEFGVITSIMMVISFAELFSDSGFQKYIIQKEFSSSDELEASARVAFGANFLISVIIMSILVFFRNEIAILIGLEGYGMAVMVTGFSLPITSFSTIQIGLFRRRLSYRTIFYSRILGALVPLLVTIPIALLNRSYWAIIYGYLATQLVVSVFLTICSSWKPRLSYNLDVFKKMVSSSFFMFLESLIIWVTIYIDIFILIYYFDKHEIGLYKTSMNTINQIMAVFSGSVISVLFSSLSRLQNDEVAFKNNLMVFQKIVGIIVIPMSVGIFIFKDLVTYILLGEQWTSAVEFIGFWGLVSGPYMIFGAFSSEAYRAKGKPLISVIAQLIYISIIVFGIFASLDSGFKAIFYARSFSRVAFIGVHLILTRVFLKIRLIDIIKNIYPVFVATIVMGVCSFYLESASNSMFTSLLYIILSVIIYLLTLLFFTNYREFFKMVIAKRKIV